MSRQDDAIASRNARLRWDLIRLLYNARGDGTGWLRGRFIMDLMHGSECDSESLLLQLLGDLKAMGALIETDHRRYDYQSRKLNTTSYKITADGVAIAERQTPPNPMIGDGRIQPNSIPN